MTKIRRLALALLALAALLPATASASKKLFYKLQAVTDTGATVSIVDNLAGGDAAAFNADVITVCNEGTNDVWVSPRAMPSPSPNPTGALVVADGPCVKLTYDKSDVNSTVYNQIGWASLYAKTATGESCSIEIYASRR